MTKELLSKRGIAFEALDIENDPGALEQLQALGLTTVPVVAVGDRYVAGWNPPKVAELVGFQLVERATPPEQLIDSLKMLLEASLRAVRQVPDAHLTMKSPDRDRPLRQLAHHCFRVIEVAVDADVLSEFPAVQWITNDDIPGHTSAARIVRYGEAVQAKVLRWFAEIDPAAFDRTIDADVGPRTLSQILERTRFHAAQHLRQVYVFLDWIGIQPDQPLTEEDLKGIELPEAIW
jgi:DinB superfamily/Glutaredoxin